MKLQTRKLHPEDVTDFSARVERTRSWLSVERAGGRVALAGDVVTRFGIVNVLSVHPDDLARGRAHLGGITYYRVVVGGRLHTRRERCGRSRRGLAIMAARFACEKHDEHRREAARRRLALEVPTVSARIAARTSRRPTG